MTLVHTLKAFNTATASDNKIHDDDVAGKLGFTGGLVPGVEVLAYMSHVPVQKWGMDFLTDGRLSGRMHLPVYDGETTHVTGVEKDDGGLGLTVTVDERDPDLAVGFAELAPDYKPLDLPAAPRGPVDERAAASPESLPEGLVLGTMTETYMLESGAPYLHWVSDRQKIYENGRIAHPGYLIRRANFVLAYHIRLGPWIHVESDFHLHGLLTDGEEYQTRAVVTRNWDHKGHRFVRLDVSIVTDKGPVMSADHTAIYEPRQVRKDLD